MIGLAFSLTLLGLAYGYFFPASAINSDFMLGFIRSIFMAVAPVYVFMSVFNINALKDFPKKTVDLERREDLAFLFAGILAILALVAHSVITAAMAGEAAFGDGGSTGKFGTFLLGVAGILKSMIDNPFKAFMEGNFLSIALWAYILGKGMRNCAESTKKLFWDFSSAMANFLVVATKVLFIALFFVVAKVFAESGFQDVGKWGSILLVIAIVVAVDLVLGKE